MVSVVRQVKPSGVITNGSASHATSGLYLAYGRGYPLAVLSVGFAVSISLLLERFNFWAPASLLLMFAVAISSWFGNAGATVVSTLLATISFYWFFVQPVRTIYIYWSEIPYFFTFVGLAILFSWFGRTRRRVEQKLREQASALQEKEARLAEAQTLAHTGSWYLDVVNNRLSWSDEVFRIFRVPMGRPLTYEDFLLAVHPDDRVAVDCAWKNALIGEPYDIEHRIVAGEEVRWVHETARLVFDEHRRAIEGIGTVQDITERKSAENALCRLNRELRAISDCNQVLLRANDEQTLLNEVCRIVCEEAGYRPVWVSYVVEDEGKSVRPVAWAGTEEAYLHNARITWSEDSERGCGPTGTAIRTGATCCVQDFATDPRVAAWRELLLQGGFRSAIAVPLKDEHGKVFGTLTMQSDRESAFTPEEVRLLEELAADLAFGIVSLRTRTARNQAEQEVSLLSFALNGVHEAALLIDDTGRFQYANREACQSLGYSREELLGMFVHEIDVDSSLDLWPGHWRELKSRQSLTFESRHRKRDGSILPVEVSANYFEWGDRGYNLALVRDITERKRAEQTLRESETRFRTIFDQAADAFFVQDFETGEIVDVNCRACESLGYTREELIGKTPLAFDQDVDEAALASAAEQAARGGTVLFHRHSHRRKNGSSFPVEVHISAFMYGGRCFLLKVARDISDRVHAEEQRAKLHDLEAELAHINRISTMGELAASIAHELKQPITASMLTATTGLKWLKRAEPKPEKAQEALENILKENKRAGEIIDRLRSLYRKAPGKREWVAVNQMIEEMAALLRSEAMQRGVSVRTNLARDLPGTVADRIQLQQVLMNLMLNAIEAMKETGGALTVQSQIDEEDRILISVHDTGVGLPAHAVENIFDAFFTTKPQGSGMGLAISRSIVESHGGKIWAKGNEGRGASFYFTLPAARQQEPLDAVTT